MTESIAEDEALAALLRRQPPIGVSPEMAALQQSIRGRRYPLPPGGSSAFLEASPEGEVGISNGLRLWIAGTIALAHYRFHDARRLLGEAVRRARESDDESLAVHAGLAHAEVLFMLNEYSASLDAARTAHSRWQATGDPVHEPDSLTWIGASLTQLSRYQEAFEKLHGALDRYKALGREARACRALNYVAIVHEELGDIEEGFRVYEEALAAAERDGDPDMCGRILGNLGEACVALGKYERGLAYLDRAITLLAPLGADSLLAWCHYAVARVHVAHKRWDRASETYEIALGLALKGGALRTHAEVLNGLGKLHASMGDYAAATRHLEQALGLCEEARVESVQFRTNEALADVHERYGNHEAALRHFKAFHRTRAAVYDEIARAKVSSLKSEFELEKTRQQQEIYQLRNVELASAYDELKRLHEEVSRQAELLQQISIRDGLTGTYNRRFLDERLKEEVTRAARYRQPLSAALLDIDHFKSINDSLSHAIGDDVLQVLATVVSEQLRDTDLLVRYGGEEFVVLLPLTALENAGKAAEKVRAAVEEHDWKSVHPGLRVTVSIGVAEMTSPEVPDSLIDAADRKLYEAKKAGRNRVRF
jgi:diguanylate cyclase (GGDEF)-like protein